MITPTKVYVSTQDQAAAGAAAVLASLPLSYEVAEDEPGAVSVIDGGKDWPRAAAAALEAGSVAVVVVHPSPADLDDLLRRRSLVALDRRWTSNPAVSAAKAVLADALPRAGRLECRAHLPVGADLETALLDQLALVRALLRPVNEVRLLTHDRHGFAAEADAVGCSVDLEVVCTDAAASAVRVRLLTDDGGVELHIPDGSTARPAELLVTTPEGALLTPTRYETGHRATWRRVRSLLTTASPTCTTSTTSEVAVPDLGDFAADRNTARTAFQLVEG